MKNKIALVTGGGRGLGKDMSLKIAEKGMDMIVTYNSNKYAAEEVVNQIKVIGQNAIAIQLNVEDGSGFAGFLAELKSSLQTGFATEKIDYLINY